MEALGFKDRVSPLSLGGQNSHSTGPVRFSNSQTLASDLLIIIVEMLSTYPDKAHAPLTCSHVCRHWRETIVSAPSLWTHVDTSRGAELTHLWLTNANNAMLDVRLWDCAPCEGFYRRMLCHLSRPKATRLDVYPAVEEVMQNILRWRSVDVAFSCISSVSRIVKILGDLSNTLLLDSLTIGPMGQTVLAIDDDSIVSNRPVPSTQPPAADPTLARSLFRNMNVKPAALYVDTYPVAFSPIIFSPHLTVLEVISGNYHTHLPDADEWHQILSHTPQLIRLRLWNPRHQAVEVVDLSASAPLQLLALEHLELTGAFTIISPLFTKSHLPMLQYLLLDCLDTINIPLQLAEFGSISPTLTWLHVGSMYFSPFLATSMRWAKAFRSMSSLRVLTFAEMEWREVVVALEGLEGISHGLMRIELKEIWDLNTDALDEFLEFGYGLPAIEVIDCLDAHDGRCTNSEHYPCSSEAGSNYSSNSSFVWESGCPSSVLDSEGSEISSGEDEGPEMGEHIKGN